MEKVLDKENIEINEPKKRKIRKSLIRRATMALALALTLSGPVYKENNEDNSYVVEAATKDKKKPKITFKGNKKLTAEEGEAVTIPKTTYSDNITKKKKLKVAVTVKKGKKNYKNIANKIRIATLKSKTVKVLFPEEGTYKIDYTVTDQAKNKKTATRTVTINTKKVETPVVETTTEQKITTENLTVDEKTTEQKTTTEIVEPASVVEQPTTEIPTVDEKITIEDADKTSMTSRYADYDIKTVTIGENKYNITHDQKFLEDIIWGYQSDESYEYPDYFEGTKLLEVENNYSDLYCDENDRKQLFENYYFLKAYGNILASDYNNDNISNNVVIFFTNPTQVKENGGTNVFIYVEDSYGNREVLDDYFKITPIISETFADKEIINSNPYLLGTPYKIKKNKTLVLK